MARRVLSVITVLTLVVGACGGTDQEVARETTSTSTSLQGIPSTSGKSVTTSSSTSTTAPEVVLPSYLVYGWDGVTRVKGGMSEQLVSEPVTMAVDDGADGIVFRSWAEEPGWAWLQAGAMRPKSIDLGDWPPDAAPVIGEIGGRSVVLVTRINGSMTRCEAEFHAEELALLDLKTGDQRFLTCSKLSPALGQKFTSQGGGLLLAVASSGLAPNLRFYRLDGEEMELDQNPFAESCAPCHLTAELAPDGSLLAYAVWPRDFWISPQPDVDREEAFSEWYEQQQDIPTHVVVMEMATGVEVFHTLVYADARLTEFDGRFVTLTSDTHRTIFDIETGEVFEVPPALTEPVGFWTVILASLDNTTLSYDEAQVVAGDYEIGFDVETGVLWSDGFITLNPGYWAVFTGHFSTRAKAVAQCEVIDTACYARYVATVDTIDPALGRSMLTLGGEGLGLVSFGEPEHQVVGVLTRLLGEPSRDSIVREPIVDHHYAPNKIAACNTATGYACFDYIRFVSWDGVGLRLTFADLVINESATAGGGDYYLQTSPNLRAYSYAGGEGVLPLATTEGITVGSTLADLREAYGDRVTTGWDECANKAFYQVHETPTESSSYPGSTEQGLRWGFFSGELAPENPDEPINPAARIGSVNAGARSSC